MGRKSHIFSALLIVAIVLLYAFYPTDKKRIKMVIEDSTEAIMQEDLDKLMEHISFNYRDQYGGSYLLFKKRMEKVFTRFDDFDITADIMKVSLEEGGAEAELKMSIIASERAKRGYLIGDAVGAEDVRVVMEKSPYEWKVTKVERIADNN